MVKIPPTVHDNDVEGQRKKVEMRIPPFHLGYALEWDLDSGKLISDKH
jgi:hypothetical protein